MSKTSRPVSIRVPNALDDEVKALAAASDRSYADMFMHLVRAGLAPIRAQQSSLSSGAGPNGNGRDLDPDEDGQGLELPPQPPFEPPEPEPPPVTAAPPERVRPPALTEMQSRSLFELTSRIRERVFVGELRIVEKNPWWFFAASCAGDPVMQLLKITSSLEQRGLRRNSEEGLIELEKIIANDPEALQLMAEEHAARSQGRSILEFFHDPARR